MLRLEFSLSGARGGVGVWGFGLSANSWWEFPVNLVVLFRQQFGCPDFSADLLIGWECLGISGTAEQRKSPHADAEVPMYPSWSHGASCAETGEAGHPHARKNRLC